MKLMIIRPIWRQQPATILGNNWRDAVGGGEGMVGSLNVILKCYCANGKLDLIILSTLGICYLKKEIYTLMLIHLKVTSYH